MSTIQNSAPGPRPIPDGELQVDITRPNRQMNEAVFKDQEARRARHALEHPAKAAREARPDSIDVSADAHLMLARSEAAKVDENEAKRQRIVELRERYLEGKLNTPERVEQAAVSLLGG